MPYLGTPPQSGFITTAKQRVTSSTNNYVDLDHAISNLSDVIVWVNFVKQDSTNLSLTTSSRITLGATLVASDIVEIAYLGKAVNTQTPSTGSVSVDMLSASGTKSSSTFLAGDNSFKTVSGTTINNNADNRVITGSGTANTLEGEANLRFDGSTVRVGSGTTSPDSAASDVVVEGSGNTGISILSGGSNSASLYLGTNGANNDGVISYLNNDNEMHFDTAASTRFIIASDGTQYVNTTSGNLKQASSAGVVTKGGSVNGETQIACLSGNPLTINRSNDDSGDRILINFYRASNNIGLIGATNSSTHYNTNSDYRLKENQVAISDGIERLKQLKPYKFNFKIDADKIVDGFFAHEVTPVVPEAISGDKDAVDSEGNIEPQSIDQSKLVPLLTSALQEAITKIETLEARVKTLEEA